MVSHVRSEDDVGAVISHAMLRMECVRGASIKAGVAGGIGPWIEG